MSDSIKNFYANYDEEGRLSSSKHGQVEFLTTMRYVEKYLTTGNKILEIGAATGCYSHALAQKGYTVDAIELLQHNIEIFKSNTKPNENISIQQGDARDLSVFSDNTYDITLLLGPLYHLFSVDDKKQAINEALRVTKPGGVIFAAYCMGDASIMNEGFKQGIFSVADFIEKGFVNPDTFEAQSCPELIFELVRKEQIDALMQQFPVQRLHYVASDLYTNHMREEVDAMSDEQFALYLKYHFTICERPDMLGITHHSLDIFSRKA